MGLWRFASKMLVIPLDNHVVSDKNLPFSDNDMEMMVLMSSKSSHEKRSVGPAGIARLSVGFLLMPRFTLTPFAAMVDVFRLAGDTSDFSKQINCRWDVLSGDGAPIQSSCGFEIAPTRDLSNAPNYDYLAVIGGVLHDSPRLSKRERAFVVERSQQDTALIGVCTGSFELLHLGLMEGRRCCVSWFHVADFLERFPGAEPLANQSFVDEGDRITCAGGAGAAELAARLVDRHCGVNSAQKALRILLIEHAPGDSSAQPATNLAPSAKNERVRRTLLVMEQHIAEPLPVSALAARLKISERQLARDFKADLGLSPAQVYLRLRLEHARITLAATADSVTTIAHASGFADSANFSKQFKLHCGLSPRAYRQSIRLNPSEKSVRSSRKRANGDS